MRRFYEELWNEWRFDLVDELVSDGLRFRGSLGTETEGRAGFVDYARSVRAAFPDFRNRIDELVVEGNRAAVRITCSGTHHGEVLGVPPTGKRIEYAAAGFFTFDHDIRIADLWVLGDLATLREQLGR